ncbi:TPA: radical SAM protein [Clostridium botulinum]|uniref:radical SAM protein n=1 Tax=Clostridium botulinum TaxID=1491 RepID=UPI0008FCAB6D|nr:radical SAM protein [Clostridium botulinum]APC79153.1 radical SAM superfamily protein [Clostridium botulinum]MCS4446677.1 radical SAM protein [Clostridium botulinum]MCS4458704.1 radical SAM protein [Clostridium botulinum]MCS4460148.1 radical SAM protein [Clostridium botulinum]MCS4514348.1 radical SAM protein [Clostridium botulinum]
MNVTIFFTRNCNMNCKYCYEGSKYSKDISNSVLKQVIPFITKHMKKIKDNKLSIVTHGGEPLMAYDKIKAFVKQTKEVLPNVEFSMTTNCTILDDDILNFIIKEYDNISVSIDGTREAHDLNRILKNKKGSYDIVIPNALKILRYRPDTIARMTVNSDNVKYLFQGVKELVQMGFSHIMPTPDEFDTNWDEKALEELHKQGKLISDYVAIYSGNRELDIGFVDNATCKMKNSCCDGGITTITIDTDGKVYPCIIANGLEKFCLGDVFKGIDGNKMKQVHLQDQQSILECLGCKRYDYCTTTRCKIINKIKTGNFNEASPITCNLENISVALALYENEKSKDIDFK